MTVENSVNLAASSDGLDRRTSNRVSYETTLGFTSFTGKQAGIPRREQFTMVNGSDFSHTGISFITGIWPSSDQLVLMLNSQSKVVYAVARIVGCVSRRRTSEDVPQYEVRCEFETWLSP